MLITLTINKIPNYLKESELYKNIESIDSDYSFDVPEKVFKNELVINTFDDLVSYIMIFDYWIINKIPIYFYDWIFKNKDKININLLNDQFHMNDLIDKVKNIIETSDEKMCGYFASVGNLELLKYAHENGYSWDSLTCYYAVECVHLECLKYAHENGCEWDSSTCSNAAANGHLECLRYAHENGCDWDSSIYINISTINI